MATFAYVLLIIVLLPIAGFIVFYMFETMVGELWDDLDRIKQRLSNRGRKTSA